MATNKINVVEKTPGKHIEYALSGGKKITFGDDELTINLASRERDFKYHWTFALTKKTAW